MAGCCLSQVVLGRSLRAQHTVKASSVIATVTERHLAFSIHTSVMSRESRYILCDIWNMLVTAVMLESSYVSLFYSLLPHPTHVQWCQVGKQG